uniref:Uncharacterized protein n=1 Tax=viral metagenome TaxID=1070528 RepID=A0A6C0JKZ2_9ZZZZ
MELNYKLNKDYSLLQLEVARVFIDKTSWAFKDWDAMAFAKKVRTIARIDSIDHIYFKRMPSSDEVDAIFLVVSTYSHLDDFKKDMNTIMALLAGPEPL